MSEEKSKGISLRKKRSVRPKISAPKQISAPMPTGLAAGTLSSGIGAERLRPSDGSGPRKLDAPRQRPPQGEKTADLVKRRYSTRFTNLPTDFGAGAPPLPTMPGIPGQYASQPPSRDGRPPGSSDGQRVKVDEKALRDPNLRPEQYVATLLSDASEQDIRDYQDKLRKLKNRTSTDLQHNVYQNRTQFIKISKEAEKLKGEMRMLRTLMSELTSTLGQTTSASGLGGDAITARKQANRSSVANLEALWNSHLQTLWKRVEGSQKYLPAIPGRHIIHESGKWVELNAATWKIRRRIHLILLNDHFLVASEKKRADMAGQNPRDVKQKKNQIQTQLVAQRCWPLQDVQLADLSSRSAPGGREREGKGTTDAINIRVGTESYTFAVYGSDVSEKNTLLSTYRKTLEDLRRTMEVETEERGKQQDSVNYFATRDLSILKKADLLESLSENTVNHRSSMFVDVDGKQQSIRWVESQLDDLDIDIALQRFEKAVSRVEKLKSLAKNIKSNAVAQNLLTFKVNERAAKLATVLIRQLVENHSWLTSAKTHVHWVSRLGFEDRARDAYLEARSAVIKTRSRQCIFEGHLPEYIYQISFIYFTIIKNTVHIYQNCFPHVMMSACIKWAKEHIDEFNVILARQLSSVDTESPLWKECMDQAHTHAAMLTDVGLDFKDFIGKGMEDGGVSNRANHGPVGLGVTS
ncbi:hypothetical protein BU16DRAFT_100453 [Lophium mytilinum]|uniref:Exocyst complex component EXO84 n=1 Tax=Lophium mytilinum TaxID=390894 RepID=A0A6A6QJ37_9PEZI|nr:hypothetical protein BU16DRAFT_100453 [Lophium mytilinum]